MVAITGALCTLAFAGGGLNMGRDRPERQDRRAAADLVTNNMLLGTVMHTLFDIPNLRLRNNLPAEGQRVITNAQPIKRFGRHLPIGVSY